MNYEQSSIQTIIDFAPEAGLILGSGLGSYGEKLENPVYVNYADIDGFPVSQVIGHNNRFILGTLYGRRVLAMQGRVHYYEGYSMQDLAIPVRIMKLAGIKTVILTNAAGGINLSYKPGDLMLIKDHINLSGSNPLIGPNDERFGTRFPDMGDLYTKSLREKIAVKALERGIPLQEGVYIMFSGPNYETPAEIRMGRAIGGDAAGMSTVPEAIIARHAGMQVIGISCITNMAAGILDAPLSHKEVFEVAQLASAKFEKLIDLILEEVL